MRGSSGLTMALVQGLRIDISSVTPEA